MKKRKIIVAGLLLTLITVFAAGCKDNDREDYLEDKVEQLEQQVTELEKKDTADSASKSQSDNQEGDAGSSASTASDYETLQASVNDISDKINSATPTGSASEQRDQYYTLKQELDGADHQLDLYDDSLEDQYHSGALEASDYREQERKIDELEDILDNAEDSLERLFGIDD